MTERAQVYPQKNCGSMKILRLTGNLARTCDPGDVNTAAQASISEAFGLVVRFTLRPGHEREFDKLVAATVAEIEQHEPGTLLYIAHLVDDDPQTRIFYELYRDKAAFEAHEEQPHVQHFLAEREWLVDRVEVDRLSPRAYAGIGGADT
jgi:quinol monooxygenase YgiN